MPESRYEKNVTSSDIRCSFLQNDELKVNPSLKKIRDNVVASDVLNKIKGILRIHIELPSVGGMWPFTHIERNLDAGTEDVMVYIHLSNMDDFFYEGIPENKREIVHLKKLICYLSAK